MTSNTRALCIALGVAIAGFAGHTAGAQTWPDRQIKLIVPQPPGGGFDTMARLMADQYRGNSVRAS